MKQVMGIRVFSPRDQGKEDSVGGWITGQQIRTWGGSVVSGFRI
jgi:hypothetical protein